MDEKVDRSDRDSWFRNTESGKLCGTAVRDDDAAARCSAAPNHGVCPRRDTELSPKGAAEMALIAKTGVERYLNLGRPRREQRLGLCEPDMNLKGMGWDADITCKQFGKMKGAHTSDRGELVEGHVLSWTGLQEIEGPPDRGARIDLRCN